MMTNADKPYYLYIHVPFCRSICHYCDFTRRVYDRNTALAWLMALETEKKHEKIRKDLKTIYIGGGTPNALDDDLFDKLLAMFDEYTGSIEEFTVEINPETLTEEKAAILNNHGVNRISVGFQSSDPALLKSMNRRHSFAGVEKSVKLLKKHGMDNISLDIMYSLPGQTMSSLRQSVDDALSLEPSHLSAYSLTVGENSVFGKNGIKPLDEETEADMCEWLCGYLADKEFIRYEIANFAKADRLSVHNLAYWNYCDFIGLSAGASGKTGLIRYDHETNVSAYIKDPLKRLVTVNTVKDAMFEMVMMGMRLKKGMDLSLFEDRFHTAFDAVYADQVTRLTEAGLIEMSENHVRATERGYAILNDVLLYFLDD